MTLVHALSILSVALAQAAPAPSPGDAAVQKPVQPQLPEPRLVPVPSRTPPPALVAEGAPVLRLDRTSRCFERAIGGRWRAQCDATAKTCLVAPDAELSAEGEAQGDLDRASACVLPGWREDDLVPQGYKLVMALAESPPGWRRDERQRVMQVNFDLARRVWLGAGYGAGTFPWSDQGEGTAGVRWDVPFRIAGAPALARIRALETFVGFNGEFADFTVFGVDASRAYPSPLIRLTTFVGKPRRFDPPLYVGGWLEVVRVESLRTASGRWFDRVSAGSAAVTLDLWRSRDLASFVRLRGGAGYETVDQLTGGAWTPQAGADLDLTLDRGGFQHVRGTFLAELITPSGSSRFQPEDATVERLPSDRHRYTGKAEYEWIFLAVNDQPLSLVLDARAQSRNDVPELPTKWFFQGTASVRFNLFAPARRDAPQQDKL